MVDAPSRISTAIVLLAALLGGCVADGPQPPRPAEPRVIQTPSGLKASEIVLSADSIARDTDGNGFADEFTAIVYLFPPRDTFALPIHLDGTFRFILTDRENKRIGQWEILPEQVAAARARTEVGPVHIFRLSINDFGSDRLAATHGQLTCAFRPSGGDPIQARGQTTIRIGPLRRDAARSLGS